MAGIQIDLGGLAGRALVALFVAAGISTILSIAILTVISHNFYAASYYTFAALLDASPFGSDAAIAAAAPVLSANFDEVVFITILDGVAKAVIIGFVIAAFINFLTSIDLRSRLSMITVRGFRRHTIICGYSMLAERLCKDLKKGRERFVVVEKDAEKANVLRELGYTVLNGDFRNEAVLHLAGIGNAKAIIFATESDYENLLGIVTARHTDPHIRIISRAREQSSVTKMQRAGAEYCLIPEIVAGLEMGENVAKAVI